MCPNIYIKLNKFRDLERCSTKLNIKRWKYIQDGFRTPHMSSFV